MISEVVPANPDDYYYTEGKALFRQITVQAFNDAGAVVSSIQDILGLGVYLTTAVKCGETGYGIKTSTILRNVHPYWRRNWLCFQMLKCSC